MADLDFRMHEFVTHCSDTQLAALLDAIQMSLNQSQETPFVMGAEIGEESDSALIDESALGPVRAAKRPLNSWMAFRSYYSTIFSTLQQKQISGFLTRLWQEDPFKAKWTLLAKAYSIIRDQVGKEQAPLDEFLKVTTGAVGLIGPGHYLRALGWEVRTVNGVTELDRPRTPIFWTFPAVIRTTNMSVDDVIQHCRGMNYLKDSNVQNLNLPASIMMASGPQTSSPVVSSPNNSDQPATAKTPKMANTNGKYSKTIASMDLQENAVLLAASGDTYPFNEQFRPDDNMALHFDPHAGNPLDMIDLSEWNDIETLVNWDP